MTPPERDRRSHVRARRGGGVSALSLIPSALRSPPPPGPRSTRPQALKPTKPSEYSVVACCCVCMHLAVFGDTFGEVMVWLSPP